MSGLILIVDDESDLVGTLEYNLQREGFRTLSALTGRGGLELARREPTPDLVLLDLMLPDISGNEVCRALRMDEKTRNLPVVMLTARGEETDRVLGLELGADDYVTKPFSMRELVLRVRAILRRLQPVDLSPVDAERYGELRVDREGYRIWVGPEALNLTALEFRLLTSLIDSKGRVQTREFLLRQVWQLRSDITTRTVDTHVQRLRKKLGLAGPYIETVRGVGYRFRSTAEPVPG